MENATNAVIIAGAVLIAILMLTIGVMLVGNLRNTSDAYVQSLDATELRKYNSHFEAFIGRENISIQEIITLIGVVQEKEQNTEIYVKYRSSFENVTGYKENEKNTKLNDYILKYTKENGQEKIINEFKYTNDSIKYDQYGKVLEIKFELKK